MKPDLTTFNQSSVRLPIKNIYAENKEQRLLSQLLDLLAACKKSKPKLSTATPSTTVLIDTTTTPDGSTTTPVATTTPGEINYLWLDNQWGDQWSIDGVNPGLMTQ